MWISSINIKNYRLFSLKGFEIERFKIPDGSNKGSGLNVFVGENGCGKTSLLEAIALPLLEYKTENFTVHDLNKVEEKTEIKIIADSDFEVDKTVPKGSFKAKGFKFEGGLRSRKSMYFSSVVTTYQWFEPTDGENIKDGSPDLRTNIDNPYKGPRFKENDFLFLDKNRTFQIRSGTFNKTRFDRLMEDFNYQYIKSLDKGIKDLSDKLDRDVKVNIENEFLAKTVSKFKEITDIPVTLELIDNNLPFQNAFFGQKTKGRFQIKIDRLGSGYEMIFSLLYSFYLAEQSGRKLVILLDEPELHLHPKLQQDFVDILLELSKTSQIILTTQSPLLIKQLSINEYKKVNILQKEENNGVTISPMSRRVLPTPSANEMNYIAFNLATTEYHNELYGHLQEISGHDNVSAFDNYLQKQKNIKATKTYFRSSCRQSIVTLCTYIRHKIHHPENKNNPFYNKQELKQSIELLRNCF